MADWYIMQTRARAEKRAQANLRRQGFKRYLPQIRHARRHARKHEIVPAPLFPGYFFVKLDLVQDRWRSVNGPNGAKQLLCSGDRPDATPEGVVDALMAHEDEDGLITLQPRPLVAGGHPFE